MKFLLEEYWKPFRNGKAWLKGKKFEKLVKDILDAKYGSNKWNDTKMSWDGSKDFYWYNTEQNMWAECKNYSDSIGLKIVSPSLVMAQVHEINTILFFSYSPINSNTKAKIIKYADRSKLKVVFYDDETLEKLIIDYWGVLMPKYFKKYSAIPVTQYHSEPLIDITIYKDPLSSKDALESDDLGEINPFHIFEIDICIVNRNNNEESIDILFDTKCREHLAEFEIIPTELYKIGKNIRLAAFESQIFKIYISPCVANKEVSLPELIINSKKVTLNKKPLLKPIKCGFIKEHRLIGKSYENILNKYRNECLGIYGQLSAFTIYGHSGTGKSRLYTEFIKETLKRDYIVLNFSSNYYIAQKLYTTELLMKEIIVTLYDLTSDELIDCFYKIKKVKNVKIESNVANAFKMISDFYNANTSEEYITLIDKYIEIIYEKLSQKKYLLAVDNVQFYDDSVSYFFQKLIEYSINMTRTCYFSILLTFNTDYIISNSVTDRLLLLIKESKNNIYSEKVIGFQTTNECEEYLQEILAIGDALESEDIQEIIKNTNMNPFFMNQLIEWLYEQRIVSMENGFYQVQKSAELHRAITCMPCTTSKIIEQRWQYFLKNNNEEEALLLISAIHFFGSLYTKEIRSVIWSDEMVNKLEKIGILKICTNNYETYIVFAHDIIEKFFCEKYFPLSSFFMKYIKDNNISFMLPRFQDVYIKLYLQKNPSVELINQCIKQCSNKKLAAEYYDLLYKRYLNLYELSSNKEYWLNNICTLLGIIKDLLGAKIMLEKAKSAKETVSQDNNLQNSICYGRLLMLMGETLDSMGKYLDAHNLLKEYVNCIEDDNILLNLEEYTRFRSEIYNRLHVYRRHQCFKPLEDTMAMEYIKKAIELCENTSFHEMRYVNNSDMGYLYYALSRDNPASCKTKKYWQEACNVFENNEIESKTLNYYRKKVQLALLENNSKSAIDLCQPGISYIDYGKYAYQKLFFKWWFHLALAESFLQTNADNNLIEIKESLNKAQEFADLLDSDKNFYLLQLKAIYYYYKGDTDRAYLINKQSYELINASNYKSKKSNLLKQLEENELNMKNNSNERNILSSQIITTDHLFNLPCL